MPTNHGSQSTGDHAPPSGDFRRPPESGPESAELGYETTDVNAGGIMVFLGGLFGFVIIFFFFCFLMGRVINDGSRKMMVPSTSGTRRTDLCRRADQRRQAGEPEERRAIGAAGARQMTQQFPESAAADRRRQPGDGGPACPRGSAARALQQRAGPPGVRIPIDRAMELIAEKGFQSLRAAHEEQLMAGDRSSDRHCTAHQRLRANRLRVDDDRSAQQKMDYGKAEGRARSAEAGRSTADQR